VRQKRTPLVLGECEIAGQRGLRGGEGLK